MVKKRNQQETVRCTNRYFECAGGGLPGPTVHALLRPREPSPPEHGGGGPTHRPDAPRPPCFQLSGGLSPIECRVSDPDPRIHTSD
jgi:hypothetical protein